MACFGALFQGDHLGVEIATDSHARLLQSKGLLEDESCLCGGKALDCVSGLCIDDFFVISKEEFGCQEVERFRSVAAFNTAKAAYFEEKLLGSDDKDVIAQSGFKVIGAEVLSDEATV